MSALQLHEVDAGYRAWGRSPTPVLRGLSLAVARGERVGLVGPSGCGKTTVVRCALGLHRIDAGRVEVLGRERTAGRWSVELRQRVQLLVQDPLAMLHPWVPIDVLVDDSVRIHRPELTGADREALVAELLTRVGLGGRRGALPRELSGGEQRRAGLARVLAARPQLLVADEPTAGLDAHLRLELLRLVSELAGPDCAIVWVSHDVAALCTVSDRVVCMHEGQVVASVAAAALRDGTAEVLHPAAHAHLTASGWAPTTGRRP